MKAGDIYNTNGSCKIKVIENNGWNKVLVEFQDKHKHRVITSRSHVKNGDIRNPYEPVVQGLGYIGVGKYSGSLTGGYRQIYKCWVHMIERCYNQKRLSLFPTYKGCTVHPDWHNFQNFAEWYMSQEHQGVGYHIDKDILVKGNKVYSPDTCCLVPMQINSMFSSRGKTIGSEMTGVTKQKGRFRARLNIDGKPKHLGYFDTENEAHEVFLKERVKFVRNTAIEYEGRIDISVFEAIMSLADRMENGEYYV